MATARTKPSRFPSIQKVVNLPPKLLGLLSNFGEAILRHFEVLDDKHGKLGRPLLDVVASDIAETDAKLAWMDFEQSRGAATACARLEWHTAATPRHCNLLQMAARYCIHVVRHTSDVPAMTLPAP